MHSHLTRERRKVGGWALEDGGDTARTAWWTETGGGGGWGVEVEGKERARPNEGEMCQSSLLLSLHLCISGPVIPHGPARRSLASLSAVRYQTRSRPHSYVSLSLSSLSSKFPFPYPGSIHHPDDAIIKIKVLPWPALIFPSMTPSFFQFSGLCGSDLHLYRGHEDVNEMSV